MLINIKRSLTRWLKMESIPERMREGLSGCGEWLPCLLTGWWIFCPLLLVSFLEKEGMQTAKSEDPVSFGRWWWGASGLVTEVPPGCGPPSWGLCVCGAPLDFPLNFAVSPELLWRCVLTTAATECASCGLCQRWGCQEDKVCEILFLSIWIKGAFEREGFVKCHDLIIWQHPRESIQGKPGASTCGWLRARSADGEQPGLRVRGRGPCGG